MSLLSSLSAVWRSRVIDGGVESGSMPGTDAASLAPLDGLVARRELGDLLDQIWAGALDPVTVELCRLRIAQLLGDRAGEAHRSEAAVAAGFDDGLVAVLPQWATHPAFDERRRAALRFTEGYVIDAHSLGDNDRAQVLDQLREPEAVALTLALATFDALTRTRLALDPRESP